jgi:hypothetical protein
MKKNFRKRYEPVFEGSSSEVLYRGINDKTTHALIAKYLVDKSGNVIYDKPAEKIAEAIELLWSALTPLDSWRIKHVYENFPEIFVLAQKYREVYGSPNRCLVAELANTYKWEEDNE